MANRERFPFPRTTVKGASEATQIITIFQGTDIQDGAGVVYASTAPWKLDEGATETPFLDYVIEFTAEGAIAVIGDGTYDQQIGLFGVIGDLANGEKFVLGVLGLARGGVVPQIPLPFAPDVGWSQRICDVGLYDGLGIGNIAGGNIGTSEVEVTVRVRPIRRRSYLG